ncbi:hypothetical protein BOX15_Mlig014709g1 [Macrostomum lignano]|uniref:Tyrosine-protein phosphatase domain-containing protein n=2 Tax=Macrostomum lignano TaxID=282301 RepID=A0A267F2W4_9PLAT|nr:hypothetical protein BOX15_Mlig014709g1 [Macrostomum lignano]
MRSLLNAQNLHVYSRVTFIQSFTCTPQRHQLELHRSEVDLTAEFASIPLASLSSKTTVAANATAQDDSTAIPYDFNRVTLPPTPANPSGYYNASMIDVACLRLTNHRRLSRQRRDSPSESTSVTACLDAASAFVAAVSPGDNRSDFWRSVWHSGARVVAQIDDSAEDCCLGNEDRLVCEDGLVVQLVPSSRSGGSAVPRLVRLTQAGVGREVGIRRKHCRDVWLLRYAGGWTSDGSVPSSLRDFLTFLDELDALRRALQLQLQADSNLDESASSTSSGRVQSKVFDNDVAEEHGDVSTRRQTVRLMLHCSDGASHCGLALCALVFRACLQHNLPFSLPTLLCALRGQRMRLVASPRQYRFVYDAAIESLEDTRLI